MGKEPDQGIDGIEFEVVLQGVDGDRISSSKPLINYEGMAYGSVEIRDGKAKIAMCLPKFSRANNVKPFSIYELISLEVVRNHLELMLTDMLGDISKCRLKSIECNITSRVAKGCSPSEVMNLIDRSYYETKNILFEGASSECKYEKETETLAIPRRNYYCIKCYNKSLEQQSKGNLEVESNLLRIEIVMMRRTIEKLFGEKSTLQDVLQEKSLLAVMEEYKRIFSVEIVDKHIKPCLSGITEVLFESLTQTDSPIKTLARYRQLVVDEEVFRKALKKWYVFRGKADNSRQMIWSLRKYNLSKNAILTLREFHDSCGDDVKKQFTCPKAN